jgi:hypothetical protein
MLPPTKEAVALYCKLTAVLPDRYIPALATSLSHLGNIRSALGRTAMLQRPALRLRNTRQSQMTRRCVLQFRMLRRGYELRRVGAQLGTRRGELRSCSACLPCACWRPEGSGTGRRPLGCGLGRRVPPAARRDSARARRRVFMPGDVARVAQIRAEASARNGRQEYR